MNDYSKDSDISDQSPEQRLKDQEERRRKDDRPGRLYAQR